MHFCRNWEDNNWEKENEEMYQRGEFLNFDLYFTQRSNIEKSIQNLGDLEKKINHSHSDLKVEVEFSENRIREKEFYRVIPKIDDNSFLSEIQSREISGYPYSNIVQPYTMASPINTGYIGFYNSKKRLFNYHH